MSRFHGSSWIIMDRLRAAPRIPADWRNTPRLPAPLAFGRWRPALNSSLERHIDWENEKIMPIESKEQLILSYFHHYGNKRTPSIGINWWLVKNASNFCRTYRDLMGITPLWRVTNPLKKKHMLVHSDGLIDLPRNFDREHDNQPVCIFWVPYLQTNPLKKNLMSALGVHHPIC